MRENTREYIVILVEEPLSLNYYLFEVRLAVSALNHLPVLLLLAPVFLELDLIQVGLHLSYPR